MRRYPELATKLVRRREAANLFGTSRHEAIADTFRVETSLVLPTHETRSLLPLAEVFFDLAAMSQVISDHRIHVRQPERGILLRYLLGGRTLAKGGDHNIERNPCAADTRDTIPVNRQRHAFRNNCERHAVIVAAQFSGSQHARQIRGPRTLELLDVFFMGEGQSNVIQSVQ